MLAWHARAMPWCWPFLNSHRLLQPAQRQPRQTGAVRCAGQPETDQLEGSSSTGAAVGAVSACAPHRSSCTLSCGFARQAAALILSCVHSLPLPHSHARDSSTRRSSGPRGCFCSPVHPPSIQRGQKPRQQRMETSQASAIARAAVQPAAARPAANTHHSQPSSCPTRSIALRLLARRCLSTVGRVAASHLPRMWCSAADTVRA